MVLTVLLAYLAIGLVISLFLVGSAWLLSCKFGFGTQAPEFPWKPFISIALGWFPILLLEGVWWLHKRLKDGIS